MPDTSTIRCQAMRTDIACAGDSAQHYTLCIIAIRANHHAIHAGAQQPLSDTDGGPASTNVPMHTDRERDPQPTRHPYSITIQLTLAQY